jgi:prophage antirepressor-like protein
MSQETETTKIAIFQRKEIRKIIYNNEWWFSVVDIVAVLTDSLDAGAYWRKLKQRLKEEGSEVVTFCHGLKLEASDGKKYETDCAAQSGGSVAGKAREDLEQKSGKKVSIKQNYLPSLKDKKRLK